MLPPERLRLRRMLALRAFYPLAALVALGVLLAAVVGGVSWSLGAATLSVNSWRGLRVAALLACVGLALDPARAARGRAVEAALAGRWRWLLPAALGAVALYLAAYKVYQHLAFETTAYDLALYHHAIHNTLEGRFMHAFGLERNFFSEHFSPLLLALVPVYALLPSPLTLLVLQALAVALALVPLYGLCRQRALARLTSAAVALAFAANAVLWRSFTFDFHVELFAPVFVFGAAWAMQARRWPLFYVSLLLALSVKEDMVLVTAALAVLLFASDRARWRHSVAVLVLSALWGVLAFKVVMPLSYPEAREASHLLATRYGHLGSSYGEVLLGILRDPGVVLGRLFSAPMRGVLLSLAGLVLLDPLVLLLALPSLLLHLLSGYHPQASLDVYYALNGLTVLVLALPRVLGRVQGRFGAPAALALGVFLLVARPGAHFLRPPTDADARGRALLASLPADEAVSAQTSLLTHLSPDARLSVFPELGEAQWVALAPTKHRWPLEEDGKYLAAVEQLLRAGTFGVTAREGGFVLLRRGAPTAANAPALAALQAAE